MNALPSMTIPQGGATRVPPAPHERPDGRPRREAPVPSAEADAPDPRAYRVTVWGILGIHVVLLAVNAALHSPCWDEVGHLPAGISHWQTGTFDLYRVNPPLVRTWAGMVPFLHGTRLGFGGARVRSEPWERAEFSTGNRWIESDGRTFLSDLRSARLTCIPFSVLAAWLCFHLSRRLFGRQAGLAALLLWCSSPLVLGHGALITPDVASATFSLAATVAVLRWIEGPSWTNAAIVGACLGLGLLTKFTLLLLPPVLAVSALAMARHRRARAPSRAVTAGQVALIALAAAYVVHTGYAFESPAKPLGEFRFVSRALGGHDPAESVWGNRFRGTGLAALPIPVPANYLSGIDVQRADFEGGMMSYLRGKWQARGWWYYYLYAFLVKEPVGTLLLLLAALAGCRRFPPDSRRLATWCAVWPAVAFTVLVSSQTGFNHHLRYLLPAYPFVYVLASGCLASIGGAVGRSAAWCCVGWHVAAGLAVFPHSMSYFNELVGGPANGSKHLHNSNLDWGQDLLLLDRWARRHPEARPLRVVFSGAYRSEDLPIWDEGIVHGPLSADEARRFRSGDPQGRWYAVSAGLVYDPPGDDDRYATFRDRPPDDMAGYSIYVYKM